jgi:hypothetical protein
MNIRKNTDNNRGINATGNHRAKCPNGKGGVNRPQKPKTNDAKRTIRSHIRDTGATLADLLAWGELEVIHD